MLCWINGMPIGSLTLTILIYRETIKKTAIRRFLLGENSTANLGHAGNPAELLKIRDGDEFTVHMDQLIFVETAQ